jgi:hypothetical protein
MEVKMTMSGTEALEEFFRKKHRELQPNLLRAMRDIGVRWALEAKRRVPVEHGTLRSSIIHEVDHDNTGPYCKVGTNVKYAKYLEFGTNRIAGGRVKALGTGEDITDAQAVHTWPAKEADAKQMTSARYSGGRLYNAAGEMVGFSSGNPKSETKSYLTKKGKIAARRLTGAQEQMPWLRPALNAIKAWAFERMVKVCKFEQ